MDSGIVTAIIAGSAAVTAAVVAPITTKIVNKSAATKGIPKEIRRLINFEIEGSWKGELRNEYGNNYKVHFSIKEKRKSLDGKIQINPDNEDKELKLAFWGISPEDRYFCLHYNNENPVVGHFGTVFLYLEPEQSPMVMSGQFLGFGPDKHKPFNGTLILAKVNH